MREVVKQFISLGLVRDLARERFDAAIESSMRLRNSTMAEVFLIAFVYAVGIMVVWRYYGALEAPTWYATPHGQSLQLDVAGWWYLLVSLPLFQFVLLRWYFRLFVWARFLWQVSRMDIAYKPMHADRNGGIGFLSRIGYAFTPLLLAQGTLLAGMLANRIFFDDATLPQFKLEVFTFVVVVIGTVLAPLLVFIGPLARQNARGCTVISPCATSTNSRRNGAAARTPPRSRWSEAPMSSRSPTWPIVSTLCAHARDSDHTRHAASARGTTLLPVTPLLLTMICVDQLLGQLVKVVL